LQWPNKFNEYKEVIEREYVLIDFRVAVFIQISKPLSMFANFHLMGWGEYEAS